MRFASQRYGNGLPTCLVARYRFYLREAMWVGNGAEGGLDRSSIPRLIGQSEACLDNNTTLGKARFQDVSMSVVCLDLVSHQPKIDLWISSFVILTEFGLIGDARILDRVAHSAKRELV